MKKLSFILTILTILVASFAIGSNTAYAKEAKSKPGLFQLGFGIEKSIKRVKSF